MFCPDVIELKEFYASPLGEAVIRSLDTIIKRFWQDNRDNAVIGIGFAVPYLKAIARENKTVFALMPPAQGVIHWTGDAGNLSLLADEAELPFADNSIQRIMVVHALENSDYARHMMAEIWRVLAPTGRVLVIVPNRMGVWARALHSPFAYGQPFTWWQLKQLFSEHSFAPLESGSALFFPPVKWKYLLRCANVLEKIGKKIFPGFGGVMIMEAEKQIYATHKRKVQHYGLSARRQMIAQPAVKSF